MKGSERQKIEARLKEALSKGVFVSYGKMEETVNQAANGLVGRTN